MQETCYRILSSDGQEDFVWAEDLQGAIAVGNLMFGTGVAVRVAFYKEWNCGPTCGYDDLGNHIVFEKTK